MLLYSYGAMIVDKQTGTIDQKVYFSYLATAVIQGNNDDGVAQVVKVPSEVLLRLKYSVS